MRLLPRSTLFWALSLSLSSALPAFGIGSTSDFADCDGDGLADLLLVGADGTPRLLRNAGDGSFEDLGARAGWPRGLRVRSAAFHDLDGDGTSEILMVDARGAPRLFTRIGPASFDEAPLPGQLPRQSSGS